MPRLDGSDRSKANCPDSLDANNRVDHSSPNSNVIDQIKRSLQGLRFGTVTIVVQDGVVVQIERTEKTRLR